MSEWWAGLSFEQQLYYGIAIIATILVVLQTLMTLVGGGDELEDAGDADFGDGSEHPSGLRILSTRTVVAFFVGFGWAGAIASEQGTTAPVTNAIAGLLVGVLFGAAIFFLMRALASLRHSGTLDYRNAIGEVATVYLPVPADMAGPGRVEVVVQGRLRVVQAMSRGQERLENRARVRVIDLLDETTLVVEPLSATDTNQEDT